MELTELGGLQEAALGGHRRLLARGTRAHPWSRRAPSRVGGILQIDREPSGKQSVQGNDRFGRLDLHDRELEGQDDRSLEGLGWQGASGYEQAVRAGVLHGRQVEERRDRGGEAFLRSGQLPQADWRSIARYDRWARCASMLRLSLQRALLWLTQRACTIWCGLRRWRQTGTTPNPGDLGSGRIKS